MVLDPSPYYPSPSHPSPPQSLTHVRTHLLDFWDTAGQERFNSMHPSYYHQAQACVLVFDVTRKVTYKNLANWYTELRQNRPEIPCILVANKIDGEGRGPGGRGLVYQYHVFSPPSLPLLPHSAAQLTTRLHKRASILQERITYRFTLCQRLMGPTSLKLVV